MHLRLVHLWGFRWYINHLYASLSCRNKKVLFDTLNLFEIVHRICCINAEYFISHFYFVCLHFIESDLMINKCMLQTMPEMMLYKKLIFLPFNWVPKEPWVRILFWVFSTYIRQLKKKSMNKPYIIYINLILYSRCISQAECAVYFHTSKFW